MLRGDSLAHAMLSILQDALQTVETSLCAPSSESISTTKWSFVASAKQHSISNFISNHLQMEEGLKLLSSRGDGINSLKVSRYYFVLQNTTRMFLKIIVCLSAAMFVVVVDVCCVAR
jgi:hypothetical protein